MHTHWRLRRLTDSKGEVFVGPFLDVLDVIDARVSSCQVWIVRIARSLTATSAKQEAN